MENFIFCAVNVKLFVDNASLSSVVNNASVFASRLNNDLLKIRDWLSIGKFRLTQILLNKRQRLFFQKKILGTHPSLFFNNLLIKQDTIKKHFGLTLEHLLTFQYHVSEKIKKAMNGIGPLRKHYSILPPASLLAIYKSFIRPHLDYGNVVYDKFSNDCFTNKLETVQRYISRKTVSRIRVRTSLKRSWMRRLCLFYKVVSIKLPAYIYDIIPPVMQSQRHPNKINSISCRTEYFKNAFFPCVIGEWKKLNPEIRRSGSYNIFWKSILNFVYFGS